jgi:hypothetical protein
MIDCLYTGPATDSIDCCMELEPAWTWYWRLFMSSVPRNLYIPAKAPESLQDSLPEKG